MGHGGMWADADKMESTEHSNPSQQSIEEKTASSSLRAPREQDSPFIKTLNKFTNNKDLCSWLSLTQIPSPLGP